MRGLITFSAGLALFLSACGKPSASGTYVGKSPTETVLLQIVQIESGQVSGQLHIIKLKADGTVQEFSAPVSGLSDGKAVSLSVQPIPFLPASAQVTGTVRGGRLQLSAGSGVAELERADVKVFQREASRIQEQSRQTLADRAATEQAQGLAAERDKLFVRIGVLVPRIDQLSAKLDAVHAKAPHTVEAYGAITNEMQGLLERDRAITGQDGRSAMRRNQIALSLNQGTMATNRLRTSVQAAKSSLTGEARPVVAEYTRAKSDCVRLAPDGGEGVAESCKQLNARWALLSDNLSKVDQDFRQLDFVWTTENGKQQQITDQVGRVE